jgi:hypothetical protein
MFKKFIFYLKFLKELQFGVPTKISVIPKFLGGRLVWKPFFPLAGALLFDERIRHNDELAVSRTIFGRS